MRTFHLRVRSRNKSCAPLRDLEFSKRAILRLGSTTKTSQITKRKDYIEINSAEACRISGNKTLMKQRFTHAKIRTAPWFKISEGDIHITKENKIFSNRIWRKLDKWKKIIAKYNYSSGGKGIFLIESMDDFDRFYREQVANQYRLISDFIFERYYTYSREYRIHVTEDGCFLADRKMLKEDAVDRWHRHGSNCFWISEDNPLFDKPVNWFSICESCIKAMKSIGLDICCFDVKVQNNKHEFPEWIILESNSAPALGDVSIEKYKEQITKIING